jgi:hypothetical protein
MKEVMMIRKIFETIFAVLLERLNKQEKYQYSSRICYANCIENEIEKAKKYGWEVIDGPKFAYYLKGVNSIGENPTGAYYSVLLRKKKKT